MNCDMNDMALLRYNTEKFSNKTGLWKMIEPLIDSPDSPDKGDGLSGNNVFITVWYENSDEFLQCMPEYSEESLFSHKNRDLEEISYRIEPSRKKRMYLKYVDSKDEVRKIFREYYETRKISDISDWEYEGEF